MARKYVVETWTNRESKRISKFTVSDQYEGEDDRPAVAEFAVSVLYDAESQKLRAQQLANYLNEVNEKISVYATLSNTPMIPT